MKKYLAISAVMVLALASSAAAHPQVKLDGNDSKGPLDIRRSRVTHTKETLAATIFTFNRWSGLGRRGNYVALWLRSPRRPARVLIAPIRRRNGRLVGSIFASTRLESRRVGRVTASRTGARSLRIVVPLRLVSGLQSQLVWWVTTSYKGGVFCERGCQDLAPNGDAPYLHYLDNPPPGGPPDPPPPPDQKIKSPEISAGA